MKILTDNHPEIGRWYRKELEGGTSSTGKPFNVTFRKGTTNKLLIFFFGGGLSWSEETARSPFTIGALIRKKDAFYVPDVAKLQLGTIHVGLLNTKDARNPFADWHILTLPYTTADFHLGSNDYSYQDAKSNRKILHHQGVNNVQKALELLKELIPETPDKLVISGVSAGGFGCVAYAPQISKLYPDCQNLTVYSEGTFMPTSRWSTITKDVWKINSQLQSYIKSDDLITDLFHYASQNMPSHTIFLHSNTVYDEALVRFTNKLNNGRLAIDSGALQTFYTGLTTSVKKLKQNLPNYYYFLTDHGKKKNGTTRHLFADAPKLIYHEIQDGISIANWLTGAIKQEPVDVGSKFIRNNNNA